MGAYLDYLLGIHALHNERWLMQDLCVHKLFCVTLSNDLAGNYATILETISVELQAASNRTASRMIKE